MQAHIKKTNYCIQQMIRHLKWVQGGMLSFVLDKKYNRKQPPPPEMQILILGSISKKFLTLFPDLSV